jgi:hypothetical protein
MVLSFSTISKAQPANNECSNAEEVLLPSLGETVCFNGTTVGASATFGNSFWICSGNGQDVWYKFTTGFDVEFSVDFIRGTIGNGVEINFFSQCPPGGYLGFVGCYTSDFSFILNLQQNTTYYMLVYNGKQGNNSRQGTFEICIKSEPLLLPVTLTSFTTECDNGIPLLQWTTASEQNSDYFQIERSRDGIEWTSVSKIQAMGNSNSNKDYQFIDMTAGGHFEEYYRLKQVDFDGQFEYFSPKSIKCLNNKSNFDVDIFPNPTKDVFYIGARSEFEGNLNLNIKDQSGRVILNKEIYIKGGYFLEEINLSNCSNGMYNVILITPNDKYIRKIIKN